MTQKVKNLPAVQETQVPSLGWEDPPEKEMVTHSLQYSCLENPMNRVAWQAAVRGVAQSRGLLGFLKCVKLQMDTIDW